MKTFMTDEGQPKIVREVIQFNLNKDKYKFIIFHNINMRKYSWPTIINAWLDETPGEYTVDNFCTYINSKSHLTDAKAFTEEQFENLRTKIQ